MAAFFLLLLAAAFVGLILYLRKRTEERNRILADALGLRCEQDGWQSRSWFRGRLEGADVELLLFSRSSGKTSTPYTRYTVFGADPITRLRPQNLATELWSAVAGGEDLVLGDPVFDKAVQVAGDRVSLAAALNAETRGDLELLVGRGGSVEEGRVSFEVRGHQVDPAEIRARMGELARVAWALAPTAASAARLAENARMDPEPGVRRFNLARLAESDRPVAEATARALVDDPDALVRFDAARVLGDLQRVRDAREDVKLAAATLDPEGVARILARAEDELGLVALLAGTAPVQIAACHALERCGTVHAVEPLLPLGRSILGDGGVKQAARAAVAAIQGRLGPAEHGTLALAEGGGEVSVAEEAGAVSVAGKAQRTSG